MTKKSYVRTYIKKAFTPHIQIHDELDISIPLEKMITLKKDIR